MSHRYGRLVALRDVTLSVAPGEFVFVTGPSEAGKTTLLKLIHGDLRPTRGAILVSGQRLDGRWRRGLPGLRRRVATVFQDQRLLPDMTARGNVAFALQVANLWLRHADVRARAQAGLNDVGLGARPHAQPHELSGGQQRRLAIARALVNEPEVLLADEPTANLDRRNAERVVALLERRCDAGSAVIMATHDVDLARSRPHRVLELRGGRIVADRPAVLPVDTVGAAALLAGRRPRARRTAGQRIGRVMQVVLGYQPPPPRPPAPFAAPPPPAPRLPLGTRARRLARATLGYQPPPARPQPAKPAGAWRPPREVLDRVVSRDTAATTGAWRPPVSATAPVTARPGAGRNGHANGHANGVAHANGHLNGHAIVASRRLDGAGPPPVAGARRPSWIRRLPRAVLGYQAPPLSGPGPGARAAGAMRLLLGYEAPPPRLRRVRTRPADAGPPRRPWVAAANVIRLCVGGAGTSWARNFTTTAPALGSITLLLLLAGVLSVGGFAVRSLLISQESEASVLHVYLDDGAQTSQIDQARAALGRLPHVRKVTYVSKDQALAIARSRPGLSDLAVASGENPFPASLEVDVDQPADVAGIAKVAATEPGVDVRKPTSYDAGTYDRLRQFAAVAAGVSAGFGLLVLVIAYAVSSNAIRGALLARRDELLTMQLVGASPWLVRARLAVEGALTGGLAGVLAAIAIVAACLGALYGARHLFVELLPGVTAATAAGVVGAVALVGILFGSLAALFAFRRLRT